MRTPITLEEFLFTLNQDEDILVRIIDYNTDEEFYFEWKPRFSYAIKEGFLNEGIRDWFVQDFTLSKGGLEITIVKYETELD